MGAHEDADFTADADAFEAFVHEQRPIDADRYDVEYFAADWRDNGTRYDLETRRRVEARNPELIRDVLRPRSVLDVGCGPGFLLLFLTELGIDARGIDFASASLHLAPPEVRDRITIGPVENLAVANRSVDVVICREVIEHLTVLQARRCVAEMCRVSDRLVYVTTRFHPSPGGLLDITTQFEVDPTHITLMPKGLLRALFALEGFRRRADLESHLDWAGKDRVLVYERPPDAA